MRQKAGGLLARLDSVRHSNGILVSVTASPRASDLGKPAGPADGQPTVMVAHRDYSRRRARQIAYGRWEPWADAGPVRDHVQAMRLGGASYEAIGEAAGVSPMTVHYLVNGCRSRGRPMPTRISSVQAQRLLAVPPTMIAGKCRDACGSRRRLRALVALGHSTAALANDLGISTPRVRRLLSGQTQSVSSSVYDKVCELYRQLWNQLPPERTARERATAKAARDRARAANWLPPMALDDDRIDDPAYRTRTLWRRAAGPSAPPLSTTAAQRSEKGPPVSTGQTLRMTRIEIEATLGSRTRRGADPS